MGRVAQHPRRLCTADGLWFRLHRVVVETLRTETRRILRFRKELLQMSEKLNINQWAEEDRPREKMATLGAEALSSAELLAILIGSGSTKESAVDFLSRLQQQSEHLRQEIHSRPVPV